MKKTSIVPTIVIPTPLLTDQEVDAAAAEIDRIMQTSEENESTLMSQEKTPTAAATTIEASTPPFESPSSHASNTKFQPIPKPPKSSDVNRKRKSPSSIETNSTSNMELKLDSIKKKIVDVAQQQSSDLKTEVLRLEERMENMKQEVMEYQYKIAEMLRSDLCKVTESLHQLERSKVMVSPDVTNAVCGLAQGILASFGRPVASESSTTSSSPGAASTTSSTSTESPNSS